MARPKNKLNFCKTIVNDSGKIYCIADLGEAKSPRFALYLGNDGKPIKKSNNPLDFNQYIYKKEGVK